MSAAPAMKFKLKVMITIISGPHKGSEFSFAQESITVGRSPECDIKLSNDPKVSRKHLELRWQDDRLYSINLSEKNYYLLDGVRADTEEITGPVIISLGETEIKVSLESSSSSPLKPLESVNSAAQEKSEQIMSSLMSPIQVKTGTPIQPHPISSPGANIQPHIGVQPHVSPQQQNPLNLVSNQPSPSMPFTSGVGGGGVRYNQRVNPGSSGRGQRSGGSRATFYIIVAIIGFVAYSFFSSPISKKKKDPNAIRTNTQVESEIKAAELEKEKMLERIDKIENSSVGIMQKRAESHFIRGFRDYQAGNYSRARDEFQVVINLNPEHQLGKRYYQLSKIKLDEQIKQIMLKANVYRENKNWSKCQSSYSIVLVLLQSTNNAATFKEAKKFYDECTLALRSTM